MWPWEMLLTPSCPAPQDSFGQIPSLSRRQGLPLGGISGGGGQLPLHRKEAGSCSAHANKKSLKVLQRIWHLLG